MRRLLVAAVAVLSMVSPAYAQLGLCEDRLYMADVLKTEHALETDFANTPPKQISPHCRTQKQLMKRSPWIRPQS